MVSVRYFAVTDDAGNKVGYFRERKEDGGYWLEGRARDGSWYDDPSLARYLWGGEGGAEEVPSLEDDKKTFLLDALMRIGLKYNENHDEHGRFDSGDGGTFTDKQSAKTTQPKLEEDKKTFLLDALMRTRLKRDSDVNS